MFKMLRAAHLVNGTWKYKGGLSRLHDARIPALQWLVIPERVQYKLAVTVIVVFGTELQGILPSLRASL